MIEAIAKILQEYENQMEALVKAGMDARFPQRVEREKAKVYYYPVLSHPGNRAEWGARMTATEADELRIKHNRWLIHRYLKSQKREFEDRLPRSLSKSTTSEES